MFSLEAFAERNGDDAGFVCRASINVTVVYQWFEASDANAREVVWGTFVTISMQTHHTFQRTVF